MGMNVRIQSYRPPEAEIKQSVGLRDAKQGKANVAVGSSQRDFLALFV